MIKQGVVRKGVSPSAVSGKPSELIKSGEALTRAEKMPKRPETLQAKIQISEEELNES